MCMWWKLRIDAWSSSRSIAPHCEQKNSENHKVILLRLFDFSPNLNQMIRNNKHTRMTAGARTYCSREQSMLRFRSESSIRECRTNHAWYTKWSVMHKYRSSYPWVAVAIIRGTHVWSQHTELGTLINLTFPRFVA